MKNIVKLSKFKEYLFWQFNQLASIKADKSKQNKKTCPDRTRIKNLNFAKIRTKQWDIVVTADAFCD